MAEAENVDPQTFAAVLGWSNPDTGPASLRLYATDRGNSPRWAKPRARVIEDALMEAGSTEGDRYIVTRLGDRFVSPKPPADPLRVLLADEDQFIEFAARARYESAIKDWPNAATWDGLEPEAREAWRESVTNLRPVLAALREVADGG